MKVSAVLSKNMVPHFGVLHLFVKKRFYVFQALVVLCKNCLRQQSECCMSGCCFKSMNPLLTKLVRWSRWLGIGPILFCVLIELNFISVHKTQKNLANIQPTLTSVLVDSAYVQVTYFLEYPLLSPNLSCNQS